MARGELDRATRPSSITAASVGMTFKLDWQKRSFQLLDVYYRSDTIRRGR